LKIGEVFTLVKYPRHMYLNIFLKKYKDKKVIIDGFTSIIWEYLVKKINKKINE